MIPFRPWLLIPRLLLSTLALALTCILSQWVLLDMKSGRLADQAASLQNTFDLLPALKLREEAIRTSPLNPERRTELAAAAQTLWYLRKDANYEHLAVQAYRAARQLSPSDTGPLFGQAQMYSFAGRQTLAIPLLQQALQIDPNNAGLTLELARDQRMAGQRDAAQLTLTRCLELDEVPECRTAPETRPAGRRP